MIKTKTNTVVEFSNLINKYLSKSGVMEAISEFGLTKNKCYQNEFNTSTASNKISFESGKNYFSITKKVFPIVLEYNNKIVIDKPECFKKFQTALKQLFNVLYKNNLEIIDNNDTEVITPKLIKFYKDTNKNIVNSNQNISTDNKPLIVPFICDKNLSKSDSSVEIGQYSYIGKYSRFSGNFQNKNILCTYFRYDVTTPITIKISNKYKYDISKILDYIELYCSLEIVIKNEQPRNKTKMKSSGN